MTLWLIDRNQSHFRLTDSFAPALYVSGTEERLVQLRDAAERKTTELLARFTERIDLWLNAPRQVLDGNHPTIHNLNPLSETVKSVKKKKKKEKQSP